MMRYHQCRGGDGVRRRPQRCIWGLVVLGMGALFALLLVACGGSSGGGIITGRETPTAPGGSGTPAATHTPAAVRQVYLFSRIDYPLQVEVSRGDSVTLTLAPTGDILTVAPTPGNGVATVGAPIPLPTDLENYQDVGASVDTQATSDGPIVWQLTSPERQSLLTSLATGATRRYLDRVTYTWQVRAVAAGQNTARIVLQIYFVYLDGSEQDGTVEVSQAPIPMVAVQPTPLNTTLPPFKLPLTGLTWLAGALALIRFLYGAFKTINDVTEPVRDAAKVAGAIQARMAGGEQAGGRRDLRRDPAGQQPGVNPYRALRSAPPAPRPPGTRASDPAEWPTLRQPRVRTPQRPWPPTPGAGKQGPA